MRLSAHPDSPSALLFDDGQRDVRIPPKGMAVHCKPDRSALANAWGERFLGVFIPVPGLNAPLASLCRCLGGRRLSLVCVAHGRPSRASMATGLADCSSVPLIGVQGTQRGTWRGFPDGPT